MKRKDIIKIIEKNQIITFEELSLIFDCEKKGKEKRLKRILEDLINEGIIGYNENNKNFYIIVKIKKNKKKTKKVKIKDDNDRINLTKDATSDFYYIVKKYKIRNSFPESVLKEAEKITLNVTEEEISKRWDLRDEMIFTIDGSDAKDLDDAVSIKKKKNGWELGVHIADVSYYVSKNSHLDKEAFKRGNSYYFINKVVPMFPERLSNGICSLNPGEDRLTLSIIMDINKEGNVTKYKIGPSIIKSKYRLTYEWVQEYLDNNVSISDIELKESLDEMNILFRILYQKRIKNGSIDFDFLEQKCILDDKDKPTKIWMKKRIDSERIIEEFMLIANQTIAKYLSQKGGLIYRVHEEPIEEKIKDFIRITLKLGHKINGLLIPDTKEIQRIMKEVEDKPHKDLINHILLRSMPQAKYDVENVGHFGLGFKYYTHFTSPIRRYTDLIIHRLVKDSLESKKSKKSYSIDELSKISEHVSYTERVAMEAEREFYKLKSIRFMKDYIGKTFKGVITGISKYGIFVQIQKFGIEGMVRFQDMEDDYYVHDESNFCAVGKKLKKRYTLGDEVKIRVKRANIENGFLDFLLEK